MKRSYVRGIDSIRAVGVVLVLIYHLFTDILPGGFFGVDVFFVISGFLVTSLFVKEEKDNERFDLFGFYARRVKRLLPAAAFMVVVTLALSLLISPDLRVGMREQTAAVFGWLTNYFEILTGGSYEEQFLPHLFVHTWTLGVEMHYYIFWGALFFIISLIHRRVSGRIEYLNRFVYGMERPVVPLRKILFFACVGIAVFSYLLMGARFPGLEDPSPVYYATSTRIYPLMIGSAFGLVTGMRAPARRLPVFAALPGLVISMFVIVFMARTFSFSGSETYRYGILLVSLLTILALYCALSMQPKRFFGDIGVLAWLGKRSYSIYLFHWPLYNIFRQMGINGTGLFREGTPHLTYTLISIAVSLSLAEISYRVFETRAAPARQQMARQQQDARIKDARIKDDRIKDDRIKGRGLKSATVAAFCVCAVISAFTLANVPDKTNIEEDYKHQQALINIGKMEQYNNYLSELEMNPVAMHNKAKKLPPKPSQAGKDDDTLDLEKDSEQVQEAAEHAVERDDPEGPIKPIAPPGGANVTVIGDSVTLGAAEIIQQTLGSVIVDAEVSRNMGSGADIIRDYVARGELGEYVVIALFTNVQYNTEPCTNDTIGAIPKGHRVIAVTPYGYDYMEDTARMVRDLPKFYDFVTVADWNAAIRDHDDLLAADGIHMKGDDSRQIYANLLAQAIEQASKKPAKQ
ncbi:MAG: acyltransferase [Clostridiales bacterium]|nr:acyltransferase [Clostridiales bacterium]